MKIGSSVIVNVVTGKISTFMVPQGAVNMGMNDVYVFIIDNGKARKVTISQGHVSNDRVEIKGNLKEGDQLITEGSFKLSEGAKVSVANDNPPAENTRKRK